MARPLRILYPGAIYHVMNRGLRKLPIFKGTGYYKAFIKILVEAIELHEIECLCYCLMGNHYHLLVRTPQANLPEAMRYIDGLYAQQFNRFAQIDGPLFRGRYHALVVETGDYLFRLSRYIHLNPYANSYLKLSQHYPWSSYAYYIGLASAPDWLTITPILDQFADNKYENYRHFTEQGIDQETHDFYQSARLPVIFGSDRFREKLLDDANEVDMTAFSIDYRRTITYPSMEAVCESLAKSIGIETDKLYQGKNGRTNFNRKFAIYLCRILSKATYSQIGQRFNIKSASHIGRIVAEMREKIKTDKNLTKILQSIRGQV